ncbi:MAG: tRNA pseudouridine(38-40) synthase TruA, partial [Nitrospirota bacterium]|nr:tRNA pseudouridine(38-40) synthase TruA [Nitrospirota bacterium]
MRNIKITIEYDGTNYAGWQFQRFCPSIQGELLNAIKKLTGEEVLLSGASRTDTGVHAIAQIANFKTETEIKCFHIMLGLNSYLPPDIAITNAQEAPLDFDSRHDSKGKTYIYRVLNRQSPSPLERNRSWFVRRPVDIELMQQATVHMIGEKDFASFMAAGSDASHSMREVTGITIIERPDSIVEIEVKGTAFLRHMVRVMAGTLVAVGHKRFAPDYVKTIIEKKD